MTFRVPNQYRVRKGAFASDESDGNNGAFFIPNRVAKMSGLSLLKDSPVPLQVIASDGAGWEHVSVSLPWRWPKWEEMAYIKGVFWGDSDCVVQFHPPHSEYVNNRRFCLHLWRALECEFPLPPSLLVGFHGVTPQQMESMSSEQRLALLDAANGVVDGYTPPGTHGAAASSGAA
jgi:hypothetical protein